ncbi:MAG: hypothetical protein HQL69_02125 [Magnetococcales bacterium]|nr:hypothetical protein [Magnetococcales bacterium]
MSDAINSLSDKNRISVNTDTQWLKTYVSCHKADHLSCNRNSSPSVGEFLDIDFPEADNMKLILPHGVFMPDP